MIRIPFLKKSEKDKQSKQRLLECILCFHKNTFSAADIVHKAESNPLFKAAFIDRSGEPVPFTEKDRAKMLSMNEAQSEVVVSKGIKFLDETQTESLQFLHPSHADKPQVMHWVFDANKKNALEGNWLNSLLTHSHFVVGYCGDKEDMFMQSSKVYQLYQKRGIKPVKTIRNEFGDTIVDISQNPGRRKLVKKMWLMASWKMWFGENFYSIVGKERLQLFPKASSIKNLESNVISVELYPDPFEAARPENRAIQKAFREWINMDQLEKDLS